MRKMYNEAIGFMIGCVGAWAALIGLRFAGNVLGWVFAGATLISTLLAVLALVQGGKRFGIAVLYTLLAGGITFGLVYGIAWYLTQYLPSTGVPLFNLSSGE